MQIGLVLWFAAIARFLHSNKLTTAIPKLHFLNSEGQKLMTAISISAMQKHTHLGWHRVVISQNYKLRNLNIHFLFFTLRKNDYVSK